MGYTCQYPTLHVYIDSFIWEGAGGCCHTFELEYTYIAKLIYTGTNVLVLKFREVLLLSQNLSFPIFAAATCRSNM